MATKKKEMRPIIFRAVKTKRVPTIVTFKTKDGKKVSFDAVKVVEVENGNKD